MIEIKITENSVDSYIDGNLSEICADVMMAVHTIHGQIKEKSRGAADDFEKIICDGIKFAFVEEDEMDNLAKSKAEEEVAKALKHMTEMLDNGQGLNDVINFLREEMLK